MNAAAALPPSHFHIGSYFILVSVVLASFVFLARIVLLRLIHIHAAGNSLSGAREPPTGITLLARVRAIGSALDALSLLRRGGDTYIANARGVEVLLEAFSLWKFFQIHPRSDYYMLHKEFQKIIIISIISVIFVQVSTLYSTPRIPSADQ